MNPLRFNRVNVSHLAWTTIYDNAALFAYTDMPALLSEARATEVLRTQAEYDTGSISVAAIWSIFAACLYFRPQVVAEVGTFIGRTTLALAWAMDHTQREPTEIFTCDISNDIQLRFNVRTRITQFPKQSSTDMFRDLVQRGVRCDILMLDGRLQKDDWTHLPSLLHDKTVIMLDDFEGTEKGCINAMGLMQSLSSTHLLIYPPTNEVLNRRGFADSCTLGMIIPRSLTQFTNQ